jgi:hypothetical protein
MRKIFHRFFAGALVVGSILLLADTVRACSCGGELTMDLAEKTPNIVILKLEDVDEDAKDKDGKVREISRLKVEKVYKGNLKVGEIINHEEYGWSCSWSFDKKSIGTEYLFYLNKPNDEGFWNGFICSRSTTLKDAGADLLYLDKMDRVRGKSRLSGTVIRETNPFLAFLDGEKLQNNLLTNHKVKIVGENQSIEVTSDKNGAYEIYDLPAGIYEIIPQKIEGYKLYSRGEMIDSEKVLLKPNGHVEANLRFNIFNSFSGRILDEKGRGIKDVCVYLVPKDEQKAQFLFESDCSEEDGGFKISEIPVGKYVLVVNKDGEITANEPFETFYYPNTAKKETAQIFTIEAGKQIDDIIVKPIPKVETVLIKGKVIFEDGLSPTKMRDENASINFDPNIPASFEANNRWGTSYSHTNSTDENGNFSLRVYKGQKGKLFASMHSYVGEYKDCPKLDELVRAKGDSVQDVETNILEIDAEKDLENVILKFPFPSCKKAKID